MRLEDPYALALDYTCCMMAFLLFHPELREALMIGLGGGSLAKFFYRRLRSTRVRVVELESRFGFPFTRYVSRLRVMNPCTAAELIIAP